ncbi:MAG TPA: hypothetical protein VF194_10905 [Ferrovibrio sp.]
MSNDFCRRLGIAHPVLLAPMAGEAAKPALAAAIVSRMMAQAKAALPQL